MFKLRVFAVRLTEPNPISYTVHGDVYIKKAPLISQRSFFIVLYIYYCNVNLTGRLY